MPLVVEGGFRPVGADVGRWLSDYQSHFLFLHLEAIEQEGRGLAAAGSAHLGSPMRCDGRYERGPVSLSAPAGH